MNSFSKVPHPNLSPTASKISAAYGKNMRKKDPARRKVKSLDWLPTGWKKWWIYVETQATYLFQKSFQISTKISSTIKYLLLIPKIYMNWFCHIILASCFHFVNMYSLTELNCMRVHAFSSYNHIESNET